MSPSSLPWERLARRLIDSLRLKTSENEASGGTVAILPPRRQKALKRRKSKGALAQCDVTGHMSEPAAGSSSVESYLGCMNSRPAWVTQRESVSRNKAKSGEKQQKVSGALENS